MAGNANSGGARSKPFADALRMELAAAGEDHKALRLVAQQLIAKANEGDLNAIKELADRIDGKVPQAIGGDPLNPIEHVHRIENVSVSVADRERRGI